MLAVLNEHSNQPPRVAFNIARSVGSAVDRNRLRRRLRAILQEEAGRLSPGHCYLFSATRPAATRSYGDHQGAISALLDISDDAA